MVQTLHNTPHDLTLYVQFLLTLLHASCQKKSIRTIQCYHTWLATFPNNTVNNGKISTLPLIND